MKDQDHKATTMKTPDPEAAVKFFVGVSSAGIGLIAALAEKVIGNPKFVLLGFVAAWRLGGFLPS